MPLSDPIPSSATDVFKRNIEDTDRLLNTSANVVNRVGTTLESFPNATGRVSDAADLAEVQIEAAKNAALLSYAQWNSRGDWVTATAYATGDTWNNTTTNTWYLVLNDYTSGATVNDDINGANVTVLQGAKYSTFEGLSDAVAFVTAHPELFEDYSAIKTSSNRTKSECDLAGISYPDGSGADYIITSGLVADGGLVVDAGTKQLKVVTQKLDIPVDTIADLRTLEPVIDGQQANILGHTVAGIGGGIFYYDVSDTASADDNGTVIVTSGGHRWKRKLNGTVAVEMFGGIGDWNGTTGTDNSPILQAAIDSLNSGRGGRVTIGDGRFLFSSQITVTGGGVTIEGNGPQTTTLTIGPSFSGTSLISFSNPAGAIGKESVKHLRVDSSNNLTGVNGISFKYLIYNNEFHNLDFESFTGSWFYTERSNNISEHITWSLIQGNARNVTPTKPPFDLYRINESIIVNAKVFGKQYNNLPYPTVPMLYCDRPQGFTIQSSQFTSTDTTAVKIECTSGSAQGFFLDDCTFEACFGSDVISVSGFSNATKSEYGKIGQNRYIECPNSKVFVDNWIAFEVEDNKPSIELGSGTLQCVATSTMTDGSTIDNTTTIVDNGTNNLAKLVDGSGFVIGVAGANGRYVKTSGKFSYHDYGIAAGRTIRQIADYQGTSLQRMRFMLDGTTDLGGVTNHGLYGKVHTSAGNPPSSGVIDGTIVPNSSDNRLYVYIGGAWKYVTLT